MVSRYPYDSVVRGLVLAAKNGGRRDLLAQWGRELAERSQAAEVPAGGDRAALTDPADLGGVDVVTWVPASRQGARARGYDQGRVLARAVARGLGVPARRLLVRRPGPKRMGADRARRLAGPDLRCPVASPLRVVVVDDVLTTGASLAAAGWALRAAGAERITGLVVAAVDVRIEPAGPTTPRTVGVGTFGTGRSEGG